MTPFSVRDKVNGTTVPVPCGKCPNCITRRISSWSFRLLQEEKICSEAHFLTLTYDTAHIPITPRGNFTLDKRDLQLFFKCLRKRTASNGVEQQKSIKYYAVGEYGTETERPHYHIVLFNASPREIELSWKKGIIDYGKVEPASINYVVGYFQSNGIIPKHSNDDRSKQFALMSKGMGLAYLENDNTVLWHLQDVANRAYCNLQGGKKVSMPRYYKEKLYFKEQRTAIAAAQRILDEKLNFNRNELGQLQPKDPDYFVKKQSKNQAKINDHNHKKKLNKKL